MVAAPSMPDGDGMSPTTTRSSARPSTPRMARFADLRRDRVADLVRIAALGVVIVWHSTLSLFHRSSTGVLSMPNPIGDYRGLWLLTWVLQVMPLFFVVSGAVNADAWVRHRRRGGTARSFAVHRVTRFVAPLVVLVAGCAAIEAAWRLVAHEAFLSRHLVMLVPLWTLALLVAYAPLTPWLERAWRRYGATTTVSLVAAVIVSDLVRFRAPSGFAQAAEVVSTIGVWLVAYHLGWVYRSAVRAGEAATAATGRILAVVGFVGLIVTTNIGVYPRPMVATTTDAMSNLLPTTVPIMMLALFQCGLLLLVRPRLAAWCATPRARRIVDGLGAYALPAYLFHMFVVVAMVLAGEAVGIGFSDRPSTTWWLTRPLWLTGVIVLLVPLLRRTQRLLAQI